MIGRYRLLYTTPKKKNTNMMDIATGDCNSSLSIARYLNT